MAFCSFGRKSPQMKRLPLVIAVLLITTAIGVGVGLPSGGVDGARQANPVDVRPSYQPQLSDTIETDTNVTNTLAIPADEIERSDLRRQYADLGPASAFDTGVTTDRLATRTIERELDASSADERAEQIAAELDVVDDEVDSLETRE